MKVVLIAITPVLLLAAAVLLQHVDPEQKEPVFQPYSFPDTLAGQTYNLDSIKTIIGDNKILPPGFELAAAIACSAYPELKDVTIKMELTQGGAPMESTIVIKTLLKRHKKRRYLVLLNDAHNSYFDPILLRALPFDAQVGILAHELGHIVYYEKLNALEFGKWGLEYLRDDNFHACHERTTDLMPIYHGLGSQIYQYAYYVRHDPSCVELYEQGKGFIDKYYMTDEELASAIKRWEDK